MDLIIDIAVYTTCVVIGFAAGAAWRGDTVGQLKHENERLNAEIKRWSDRDSKGRFTKRERP